MDIKLNQSLKEYNTYGVDVSAKYFVEIPSEKDLLEIIRSDDYKNEKKLILGGGSNVLFLNDYDGMILYNRIKGIKKIDEEEDTVLISAGGGVEWDHLVSYCVERDYYGIENLSLIPGSVGAAPVQNIGAYGVEVKDVFHSLKGIMLADGRRVTFYNEDCNFGYRDSIFKRELKDKIFVTKVALKLSKIRKFNLDYRELKDFASKMDEKAITLKMVSEEVKDIRKSKLADPLVYGNAGSFFKNPEVDEEHFERLKKENKDLVYFKISEDRYKIPAGWLIEKCGWKGRTIGRVGSFEKQALVIVNYGNATGKEIKHFADQIKLSVSKRFKIDLIPEVNII